MKQILIVEDDMVSRELLIRLLRAFKVYTPTAAVDLKQAREIVQNQPFDLIMLDVNLPDGNGLDLLYDLRQRFGCTCPVLVLSGLRQDVNVSRGLEMGAEDYLTKPFSMDELLSHMNHLLHLPDVALS